MTILFLHGWQSAPGGVKPTYLKDHGHTVINPKLPDEDFPKAVQIAQAEFDKHRPEVVVGSSRGGAVAMNINIGDARLVLFCPAWKKWGAAKTVRRSTVILHSRADDVVPFADSEELVRISGLPAWMLFEVGNDHRLADPESLKTMLEACVADGESLEVDDVFESLRQQDCAGHCYRVAMNWIIAPENKDWILVHGTVWSNKCGKRIDHAWCERDGFIFDLTQTVEARHLKLEEFHRIAQAEVRKKYSTVDALELVKKYRHCGPWDEGELVSE
jgi:hypothetical protein